MHQLFSWARMCLANEESDKSSNANVVCTVRKRQGAELRFLLVMKVSQRIYVCKALSINPIVAGWSQGLQSWPTRFESCSAASSGACISNSTSLQNGNDDNNLPYVLVLLQGYTAREPRSSWSQNSTSVETVLFGKLNGMRQCLLCNIKWKNRHQPGCLFLHTLAKGWKGTGRKLPQGSSNFGF